MKTSSHPQSIFKLDSQSLITSFITLSINLIGFSAPHLSYPDRTSNNPPQTLAITYNLSSSSENSITSASTPCLFTQTLAKTPYPGQRSPGIGR